MRIYRTAMTITEVLISLTIVGTIAAITLPALQVNIDKKSFATKKIAIYSRISQAIPLIGALNGYGVGADDTQTRTNAAQAFLMQGLSKNLKLSNICNKNKLSDCGLPETITTPNGTKISFPTTMYELNSTFSHSGTVGGVQYSTGVLNTDAAAFETPNGDSVAVFYNPDCSLNVEIEGTWSYTQSVMCVNFIYDINAKKGPNTVGTDIGFITALYPINSVVVSPAITSTVPSGRFDETLLARCNSHNGEMVAPNKEEIFSLFYNNSLANVNRGSSITCLYSLDSATEVAEKVYDLDLTTGKWQKVGSSTSCILPCIGK